MNFSQCISDKITKFCELIVIFKSAKKNQCFFLDGASDALYQTVEAIQGKANSCVISYLVFADFIF